ncbi:PREDICTED: alanine--glyoxylate aminotransferase 2-like [Amphimedon queenslandica]|uniref:Uncharacterized protein n=1 Tax=Amphimedon queenslandica TaxID=400682 RepID=A0A1X7VJ71_AMPQE|nr:PREDICTED: alanine--glyoxylate aminotransferase 2-like [Amphimedon queenslandica]|eukprot:XP_011410196.2 PREDICTED: alanine--glyoxylate aminotransferase 2-like [Amphimedon queenslandica]
MAVKVSSFRGHRLLHEPPAINDEDLLPSEPKKPKTLKEESLKARKEVMCDDIYKTDSSERIVCASGQYMFTDTGARYLDMRNNVHHVGHCHPKVVEAGVKQMMLLNTNSRFLHDGMVTLAKRLSSKMPGKLNCCIFTNSGSEANDLALQMAEHVTGHSEIIAVKGGYHGHLKSLRAISYHPLAIVDGQKRPENVHLVSLPDTFRGQYRDPHTAGPLYAKEVKEVIETCHNEGKKVATFISEPILCCGGIVVSPEGYLKNVYESVRAAGGLCIADEIQSGFGRVGTHFWAFEQHGVIPDIVTIGKPMGNGHPVAAVITTKEIADRYAATGVEYFNTFGGNPVSMAIASAVLDVIDEEKLQERAETVGGYLMKELREAQKDFKQIGDVRGSGLMVGVELVKDGEPDKELASIVAKRMSNEFMIFILTDGMDGNVLKIKPPICIDKENVDHFVSSLKQILSTS